MPSQIWGDLLKSQVDDELVEEAISRLVGVHESDPESHLAVGESLQSHKSYAIIDHLACSIVSDKIADFQITPDHLVFTKSVYTSNFQDFALWTKMTAGAVISNSLGLVEITVSDGASNYGRVVGTSSGYYPHSISKACVFQAFCLVDAYGLSSIAKIGFGTIGYSFAGFRWDNSTLFAVLRNHAGTEVTIAISGYNCYEWHLYKVVIKPGEGADFYVDNVIAATLSQAATSDYISFAIFEMAGPVGDSNVLSIKQVQFYE